MKLRIAELNNSKKLIEIYKFYIEKTDITFEYDDPTVE